MGRDCDVAVRSPPAPNAALLTVASTPWPSGLQRLRSVRCASRTSGVRPLADRRTRERVWEDALPEKTIGLDRESDPPALKRPGFRGGSNTGCPGANRNIAASLTSTPRQSGSHDRKRGAMSQPLRSDRESYGLIWQCQINKQLASRTSPGLGRFRFPNRLPRRYDFKLAKPLVRLRGCSAAPFQFDLCQQSTLNVSLAAT